MLRQRDDAGKSPEQFQSAPNLASLENIQPVLTQGLESDSVALNPQTSFWWLSLLSLLRIELCSPYSLEELFCPATNCYYAVFRGCFD